MSTLSLNPEKQAALDQRVQAEVERQVAGMIERIEAKLDAQAQAMIEKRIADIIEPKLERLNGMIDHQIDMKFHSWFWTTFGRNFARLNWRIKDTHDRLTTLREWVNSLESVCVGEPPQAELPTADSNH